MLAWRVTSFTCQSLQLASLLLFLKNSQLCHSIVFARSGSRSTNHACSTAASGTKYFCKCISYHPEKHWLSIISVGFANLVPNAKICFDLLIDLFSLTYTAVRAASQHATENRKAEWISSKWAKTSKNTAVVHWKALEFSFCCSSMVLCCC